MFPPGASVHDPALSFYSRWCGLGRWLQRHESFWRPAPFTEPAPGWAREIPALAAWLEALSDAECEMYEARPERLAQRLQEWIPGLAGYSGYLHLPRLEAVEAGSAGGCPARAPALEVPDRKRHQAVAFTSALLPLENSILDWCCGKGHLARTLARHCPEPVTGFEWNEALVVAGNRLAHSSGDNVILYCQDVMDEALSWPADSHGVALHACGDLHRRLLQLACAGQAPRLSLSPCCYHHMAATTYRPLSARARQQSLLRLQRDDLRLAVQETVTASARVRAQTRRAAQWRLGFDALQRQLRQCDEYLPVPSHPSRLLREDFRAFCRWAAARKGLDLPETTDWAYWEGVGCRRLQRVRRFELLRHLFRRPLELWLVLDYALYLEEQGYRVRLGTFCERQLTPRNLLLDARRVE